ncbi:MAG: diacylglycerol kinase family protein [Actinomycetota bacterium]
MRLLLVVNESASSVTARTRVIVRRALAAEHDVEEVATVRRNNATAIAMGAVHDGVDVVVGLGGDGTVNELANGLIGTDTALGVLPGGSTNVFARSIGTPDDPVEAAGHLLGGLRAGTVERIGLGTVDGRVFTFHTGLGFDAAVVEAVEARAKMKRYAGHPYYLWCTLTTWRNTDRREPLLRVELPDGEVIDDARFAVVLNTDPYTYLGSRPLHLAEEATLDRGLALVALRSLDARTLLGVAASALGTGARLRRHRSVVHRTDLERLIVRGHREFPHQVDGDPLGSTRHLELVHRPRSLSLVRPVAPG